MRIHVVEPGPDVLDGREDRGDGLDACRLEIDGFPLANPFQGTMTNHAYREE